MWFTIREPLTITARDGASRRAPLSALLKHRNVPLAMLTLLCAMSGVFILAAFMPNYLIDYLKLTNVQMGYVTSAIGFGGFLGQLGIPTLSDFIGRRTVGDHLVRDRGRVPLPVHPRRMPRACRCCSRCCSALRCSTSARWR